MKCKNSFSKGINTKSFVVFLFISLLGGCIQRIPGIETQPVETGKQGTDKDKIQVASSSVIEAVESICSNPVGTKPRMGGIEFFRRYKIAARTYDAAYAIKKPENCVKELLPSAVLINLKAGIPVGIAIAQAAQETGWCKSYLAKEALNFHGQKAHLDASGFTYWDGKKVKIKSSESPTGKGNLVESEFMVFKHVDHAFYAAAERLVHPGLPPTTYKNCMQFRPDAEEFIKCIGKKWAVHTDYAKEIIASRKTLQLERCELAPSEWSLDEKFKNL